MKQESVRDAFRRYFAKGQFIPFIANGLPQLYDAIARRSLVGYPVAVAGGRWQVVRLGIFPDGSVQIWSTASASQLGM